MTDHNRRESAKLAQGAKWVIRQLLLEAETRDTDMLLYDAKKGGYVVYYQLISGDESVVVEFAEKLSIKKYQSRLEVQHE